MIAVYDGNNNYTSIDVSNWFATLYTTSFAASMAVNTLMTGLIVFRILKGTVLFGKPTLVERTLGLGSTRSDNNNNGNNTNKYRRTIFVIIESAMALFAIQLVRIVLNYTPVPVGAQEVLMLGIQDIVVVFNQMLNVIIIIIII